MIILGFIYLSLVKFKAGGKEFMPMHLDVQLNTI